MDSNTQTQTKRPLGMWLLLGFLALGLVGVAQTVSYFPPYGVFTIANQIITGLPALVVLVVLLAVQAALLYGIWKRKQFAWSLGRIYFVLSILLVGVGLISAIAFPADYQTMISVLTKKSMQVYYSDSALAAPASETAMAAFTGMITLFSLALALILDLVILNYWKKKKVYFTN